MTYHWLIATRYLKSRRKHKFISLISLIAIGGVGLGVMTLSVVLAVMNGFERELRDKILGVNSHIIVSSSLSQGIREYRKLSHQLKLIPSVLFAAPFLYQKAMLKSSSNVEGVILRGVREEECKITKFIKQGKIDLEREGDNLPGILIGTELAKRLEVSLGDTLTAVSPIFIQTPLGVIPKTITFRITGIFEVGFYEYDVGLVYISLTAAQSLFNLEDIATGIEVRVADIFSTPEIKAKITQTLGSRYRVRDWMEMNYNLFKALKTEKVVMFIILTLIIIVAAFNIITTLIMIVMEKTKEIGVLKSLGATNGGVMGIFFLQGALIGGVGTLLGSGLGLFLCHLIKKLKLKIPGGGEVYYLNLLPVKVEPVEIIGIVAASLIITLLSAIYPAYRAARLNPVEALRYE